MASWGWAVLSMVILSAAQPAQSNTGELRPWLAPTAWIDSDHPDVIETAARLVEGLDDPRERAVRIHDFVRDEIEFGWTRAFYRMKASDVLRAKVGYCNSKATLFIALLRASQIPARQYFVDIHRDVLAGFVSRPERWLEHSFTQVFLDGRWIETDSYTVDRALATAARRRLLQDEGRLGYGVHIAGTSDWDGESDAFVQFVDDGSVRDLSFQDYGVFQDAPTFFDAGEGRRDSMRGPNRFLIPLFIPRATERVRELRGGP